jgi:hypothetical protein
MRLLPPRICRLSLAILLSLQSLLSGYASIREAEDKECLNNLPRTSYIYNYSREAFRRPAPGFEVVDIATRILVLPIALPLYVLSDTLLLPVTVPMEGSYQSRCKEMKDQIAFEQNKSINGHLNAASKESITLASSAPQTVLGQMDIWDNFVEKGLPASADLPKDNLDRAAESMAKQISQSDGQSLSVLLAALQTAGFSIIDEKRTVLRKPSGGGSGQGLGFYDFEAVGSLKLEPRGINISFEQLAGAITKDTPQLSASTFAESIIADLRAQASNSNNTYLRFWARLIIELGKYSAQPIDLMTASTSQINLSVLQASLLIRRLQGDVAVLKKKYSQTGSIQLPFSKGDLFVPALWRMDNVPLLHLVNESPNGSLPCSQTGDEALILDAAANGLTFGNGKLMELLEKVGIPGSGTMLRKLSAQVDKANWILSWGKLVAAVTMLRGEIAVDNPPLIRTRNTIPGEKRLMTAKIWSEVGKKQMVNCVRTAANIATGLDFNLPSDGPVADTAVGWQFVDPKKDNKFVGLESPQGKNKHPLVQVTDKEGVSQMWLVGAPKYQPAVADLKKLKKVTKTANVRVSVTLKSSKDFVQNWIDIGGAAIGGLKALPGSIAEIGFRLPYSIAWAAIPVIDHEPVLGYKLSDKSSGIPGHHLVGVVCSLEKPFTFLDAFPGLDTTYTLVPSSATAGQWTSRGTFKAAAFQHVERSGSYTIEEADTHTPRILARQEGQASFVYYFQKYLDEDSGFIFLPAQFGLVPLETDECNEP